MAISALHVSLVLTLIACGMFAGPVNAAAPDFAVETLARGLDTPWAIDFAPDERIFVSERSGRIRVVERGQLRAEPWMTLEVATSGEAGLLGLALDPQFS